MCSSDLNEVIENLGIDNIVKIKKAAAIARAESEASRVCDLHHSSWQHGILNPLNKGRDRTCNLMVPSWIR